MLRTSEVCSPKHPDKICDRVSDLILDWCLKQDPNSRVAIEVMGGHKHLYIVGEITSRVYIDAMEIRKILPRSLAGMELHLNIASQSQAIARGVKKGGAGDQGIMVGYACSDNEEMIPHEHYLARSLCRYIYKEFSFDGKVQITIDDKKNITHIVASFQNVPSSVLRNRVKRWLKINKLSRQGVDIYINPSGDWKRGGFDADTGLTGRKIVQDAYGPQVPVGGGAFSGKDPTKVDRSAAYMARKMAVDLLYHFSADEVIVKLAYSIGVAEPVMVTVLLDGEEIKPEFITNNYDLTPQGIIDCLKLKEPIYKSTAEWGHFGNGFPWDKEFDEMAHRKA